MGGCLSSPRPVAASAPQGEPGEAERLAQLEREVERAARRNGRLRDKIKAKDAAEEARDTIEEPASPKTWSVQVEPESRGSSLQSVPSNPASAAPRHFPAPSRSRRKQR